MVAPNYGVGVSASGLRSAAEAAQAAGFDSIWVTDHVAVPMELSSTYGHISEALVTAAFLASCTSSIEIGVSALVVPQRPLLLTLKQVMGVQLMAEGRLVLALAAGWTEKEFLNLGASMRERSTRLAQWATLVEAISESDGGPLDLHCGDLNISDAVVSPGFFDGSPPPVWMAGHADAALRRAAEVGVWHPVGRPPRVISELAGSLRRMRPDAHVVLRIGLTLAGKADWDALDAGGRCRLIGPPDYLADRLRSFIDAGCDGFVIDLLSGEGHLEDRIDSVLADVLPRAELSNSH